MLPNTKLTPAAIFDIVRRRFWLVAIPPAVGLFAGLLYSAGISNMYQSEMLIAIIPQRVPDTVVRSTVTLRADERLDEISVMVMSRTNLEQMITEMGLYGDAVARRPMDDVVNTMRNALEVGLEPSRRGPRGPEPPHAFHIRFTYSDPEVAAEVTRRIGAVYVEQNTRGRGALAEATNAFLESELEQARLRLEAQERRLEEFRELHGKELPTQTESNLEAARGLQLQTQSLVETIARDRDRKLMLERLYRDAQADRPVVIPDGRSSAPGEVPAGTSLQQQLRSAQANLSSLETRYTPDHPDVRRAKSQIAELQQQIAAEGKAAQSGAPAPAPDPVSPAEQTRLQSLRAQAAEIESLERQIAFKEGEERRLRADIADYQRRVEATPGIESQWLKLSRDYDTIQESCRRCSRRPRPRAWP
ncbi:MAG: hypothetical protein R2712_22800 [Vicinamibacterales bacterium]